MYIGYLLCVDPKWLEVVFSKGKYERAAICIAPDISDEIVGGDPVFFTLKSDQERLIYVYARVAMERKDSIAEIWRLWGQMVGLSHERAVLGHSGKTDAMLLPESQGNVFVFQDMVRIFPPVSLRSLHIDVLPAESVHKLTPEEVLTILRALPIEAQTPWTKRVVDRNNDLPDTGLFTSEKSGP